MTIELGRITDCFNSARDSPLSFGKRKKIPPVPRDLNFAGLRRAHMIQLAISRFLEINVFPAMRMGGWGSEFGAIMPMKEAAK